MGNWCRCAGHEPKPRAYTELLEALHCTALHQVELGRAGKGFTFPQNVLSILPHHKQVSSPEGTPLLPLPLYIGLVKGQLSLSMSFSFTMLNSVVISFLPGQPKPLQLPIWHNHL